MKSSGRILLSVLAVLAAAVAAALLLARQRARTERAAAPDATGGATRQSAAPAEPTGAAALAALAPEGTVLFLGTADLAALAADLRAGPAGRIAAAPGIRKFLEALRREPAGALGALGAAADLGAALAGASSGPALAVAWAPPQGSEPAVAFAARVRPGEADRAMKLIAKALATAADKVRDEPAGRGQLCRTAAPPGREGAAWGRAGDWLVVADSVAGCKQLLGCVEGARPASGALKQVLLAAGDARVVGGLDLQDRLPAGVCAALGLKSAGWLAYSASAAKDGRWTERLTLGGEPAGEGLAAALAPGGERPVLAALPASTLACLTANVADGARLWSALLELAAGLGQGEAAEAVAANLAGAAGKDFLKDVAPAFKGEFTVAWLLPRQGAYPQTLLGMGLVPGSAARLAQGADEALALFGPGGSVESAGYAGVRLAWLKAPEPVDPFCPAPAYAFRGDRLLAGSSSVPLKELLGGRGAMWLGAEEVRRLGAPATGARLSLKGLTPFIWGALGEAGLWAGLPESVAQSRPMPEELAPHLGDLELGLERAAGGWRLEVRGPLPLGAAGAAAALLAGG